MLLQTDLGLQQAAQNFFQSMFRRQQAEQAERELELAERAQKLREQDLELRQAQRADRVAQQQAAGLMLGDLAARGGLQSPAAQQVVGNIANAQAPQGTVAQLPQALEAEQAVRQSAEDEELFERILADTPDRVKPFVRLGIKMSQAGIDASVTNTLLEERLEDLTPSEQDLLDQEQQRAQIALARARAQRARALTADESRINVNREAIITNMGVDLNSALGQLLLNIEPDDLSSVARDFSQFAVNPVEEGFDFVKNLVGRIDPLTGRPQFTVDQAIRLAERALQSATGRTVEFGLTDEQRGQLDVQNAVSSVMTDVPSGADLDNPIRQIVEEARRSEVVAELPTPNLIDAITDGILRAQPGRDRGDIQSAVTAAVRENGQRQ